MLTLCSTRASRGQRDPKESDSGEAGAAQSVAAAKVGALLKTDIDRTGMNFLPPTHDIKIAGQLLKDGCRIEPIIVFPAHGTVPDTQLMGMFQWLSIDL